MILKFLRKLTYRKRAHQRAGRTGSVYLFSGDRQVGSGRLVDESQGGVRIQTSCRQLRDVRFVLNPESAQVAKVRLVWEGLGSAGFKYDEIVNVRGFVSDPELTHVKDSWREMAFDYRKVASSGTFAR